MKAGFQVHGRVQGIGYRYSVRREAQALELAGWVRNEPDGTVTGEAGGDFSRLEAFREFLEQAPGARITRLDWWALDEGKSLPFPFVIHS
ncbi:MAG: acylphosphatase [Holophaga sp.]|nr:acylphosphatase [Holophaga sp.]